MSWVTLTPPHYHLLSVMRISLHYLFGTNYLFHCRQLWHSTQNASDCLSLCSSAKWRRSQIDATRQMLCCSTDGSSVAANNYNKRFALLFFSGLVAHSWIQTALVALEPREHKWTCVLQPLLTRQWDPLGLLEPVSGLIPLGNGGRERVCAVAHASLPQSAQGQGVAARLQGNKLTNKLLICINGIKSDFIYIAHFIQQMQDKLHEKSGIKTLIRFAPHNSIRETWDKHEEDRSARLSITSNTSTSVIHLLFLTAMQFSLCFVAALRTQSVSVRAFCVKIKNNTHKKKQLLLLPQRTMKSQQIGDVGRGDSTHAQTRSVSDTNVAATLLAVRSDLRCRLGNPPLLLLQGLLQVQEAALNIPAFTVWPEMAQWDCWGRLQWRTEGHEKRLAERNAKECKVKGPD